MELNTTKEDMLERFRLYGEIYCTLATMPDNDYMDDMRIEAYQICDELDIDSDELNFDFDDEKGELDHIEIENEMISVWYIGTSSVTCFGCSIVQVPTETIRKLKSLLERYVKALMKEEPEEDN